MEEKEEESIDEAKDPTDEVTKDAADEEVVKDAADDKEVTKSADAVSTEDAQPSATAGSVKTSKATSTPRAGAMSEADARLLGTVLCGLCDSNNFVSTYLAIKCGPLRLLNNKISAV